MTVVDQLRNANEEFASGFDRGDLPIPPGRKLAVVTCMDARLDPAQFLGLDLGDAHVIRNAGGLVSDDALRSLVISHHLLGTQEAVVIAHTGCGMLTFTNDDLHERLGPEAEGVDFLPLPRPRRERPRERPQDRGVAAPARTRSARPDSSTRSRRGSCGRSTRRRRATRRARSRGRPRAPSRPGSSPSRPRPPRRRRRASIPGTRPRTVERDPRDPLAGLEGDGRARPQLLGRVARLREAVRERHREARGVRGGDQLLRARQRRGLAGARGPAHGLLADRARGRRDDRALAVHQAPVPDDLRVAIRSHVATPPRASR